MEEVINLFKNFSTIFNFKNFENGKFLFESVKIWNDLNCI
jgi:hypothetical protein